MEHFKILTWYGGCGQARLGSSSRWHSVNTLDCLASREFIQRIGQGECSFGGGERLQAVLGCSPAFGAVVGRVGAAVRKVTHYSFPTIVTLTLSFEIYVGQDMAENTLRLRLSHWPCLRIAPTPWLPVWMEQRTADLNLTGANGWLEEG